MRTRTIPSRSSAVVFAVLLLSTIATPADAHGPFPFELVVLGGPTVVSADVVDQLGADDHAVTRLAGDDRYSTAAAISASRFGPAVGTVFVATGEAFADALAAGPWAARTGGPILLTRPGDLPGVTRSEIQRLAPARIVVVGGPSAVSDEVLDELGELAPLVERVGGASRVETAVLIAGVTHPVGSDEVVIARADDFADALTAGPLVAARNGVLLLSGTDRLPDETVAELMRLAPDRITVLGGTAAISADVEADLADLAAIVERLAGPTRVDTAVAVSTAQFPPNTATAAYIANAGAFPDALAGAAIAGADRSGFAQTGHEPFGPILLTDTETLPVATTDELLRLHPTLTDPGEDNRAPIAEDLQATTTRNSPVLITLVATDPDGDPLTYEIVDQPSSGSVVLDDDEARFTPDRTGQQTFTYTAFDGLATSDVATVTVTVTRVPGGPPASPITVTPEVFDAFGNVQLVVTPNLATPPMLDGPGLRIQDNLLDGDTDAGGAPLQVVPVIGPTANGGTVETFADGSFSYLPPLGFTAADDTFTYIVTNGADTADGTVTVSLTEMVWFLDADAPPGGDGRSPDPLDSVPATIGTTGDIIHIGESATAIGGAGITLAAGQQLLGAGVPLEIGSGPTTLVPAGTAPVLESTGLGVAGTADNTVRGLSIGTTTAAGIDLDGASGTFTFADIDITDSSGPALRVNAATADIDLTNVTVQQFNPAAGIDITSHTGTFTFDGTNSLDATDGTGLQFDDADGTYDFQGTITLNGGDAGIDILNGSAGTFTFADTTITNPSGPGVDIRSFGAGGQLDYDGSIAGDFDVILNIDTTAPGSAIRFNDTGGNSLTSTNNPNGAIFLFDVDGDLTITTPTTVTEPGFSALFATDGDGTWTFNDLTIIDQRDLNGGVDVFGNQGTVNFHNLDITTDSAGTGNAATGFLAGGNNIINVTGTSSVAADGGAALALINVAEVNMTFQDLTAANNLTTQLGFAGDDGIDVLNVAAGTIDVLGTTTITNVDGVGISVEDSGATFTTAAVDIDTVGRDAVITGVAFDNTGTVTINGGTIANTGGDGLSVGSTFGSSGAINVNNVAFSNIGGFTVRTANSTLAGSGNTAVPFSCSDGGANTGQIAFNAGADTCP